jgi:hypothetical protein
MLNDVFGYELGDFAINYLTPDKEWVITNNLPDWDLVNIARYWVCI